MLLQLLRASWRLAVRRAGDSVCDTAGPVGLGGGASSPPRLEQVKVGYRLRCPLKESDADFLKDEGDKQTLSWAPRAVTSSIHRLCADFVVVVELWPQFLFISLKLPVEQQKLF